MSVEQCYAGEPGDIHSLQIRRRMWCIEQAVYLCHRLDSGGAAEVLQIARDIEKLLLENK